MVHKWLIPLIILVVVYFISIHGLKGGPEVSVDETVALLKGDPRPALIDVRERADYERGHLPGAISVPFAGLKDRLEALKLSRVDAVVLYGSDDTRTRDATRLLYENGYQGALTLAGGIEGWRKAGHALAKVQPAKPQ